MAKKSPKMTSVDVPMRHLDAVENLLRELTDKDKPRKPIKRVQKIESAELKRLTMEAKAFVKRLDKVEREYERLENLFDRDLSAADEKWVHQYQNELLKPVDALRELIQLVNNM